MNREDHRTAFWFYDPSPVINDCCLADFSFPLSVQNTHCVKHYLPSAADEKKNSNKKFSNESACQCHAKKNESESSQFGFETHYVEVKKAIVVVKTYFCTHLSREGKEKERKKKPHLLMSRKRYY